MKASRDMNPRCGDGAGVAVAPGDGVDGVGLEPEGSSAMILRIEARISSMLGSALDSSLDIPHLLATETLNLRGQEPTASAVAVSTPVPTGWIASDTRYGGRLQKNRQQPRSLLSPELGALKATTGRCRANVSKRTEPYLDRAAEGPAVPINFMGGALSLTSICSVRPSSCVMSMPHHFRRTSS